MTSDRPRLRRTCQTKCRVSKSKDPRARADGARDKGKRRRQEKDPSAPREDVAAGVYVQGHKHCEAMMHSFKNDRDKERHQPAVQRADAGNHGSGAGTRRNTSRLSARSTRRRYTTRSSAISAKSAEGCKLDDASERARQVQTHAAEAAERVPTTSM